jgi:hypothetical protein
LAEPSGERLSYSEGQCDKGNAEKGTRTFFENTGCEKQTLENADE